MAVSSNEKVESKAAEKLPKELQEQLEIADRIISGVRKSGRRDTVLSIIAEYNRSVSITEFLTEIYRRSGEILKAASFYHLLKSYIRSGLVQETAKGCFDLTEEGRRIHDDEERRASAVKNR